MELIRGPESRLTSNEPRFKRLVDSLQLGTGFETISPDWATMQIAAPAITSHRATMNLLRC